MRTAVATTRRSLLAAVVATMALLVGAASASATTYTVTTTADTTSGTCVVGSCSLRQAVAAVTDGDTIVVPASATPYGLTNGQLSLSKGITIKGAGAVSTVIQAMDSDRVMVILGNTSAAKLQDLTITGGFRNGGGGGLAAGGPGPLVLSGVSVTGNTVDSGAIQANAGGGGIFSLASVTLNHSTVSNNTVTVHNSSGDGGGGGIMMASGALTLNDSTVSGNTATVTPDSGSSVDNNGGGGLYLDGVQNLTVTRSLIQNNTVTVTGTTPFNTTPADGGGGVYQFGTNFLLRDSTVAGNTAHVPATGDKNGGGGIFDDGDTSQYLNSTVAGNSTDAVAASTTGGGGVQLDNVKGGVVLANMTITGNSAPTARAGGVNNNLITTVDATNSIIAGNTSLTGGANCDGPITSDGYNLFGDGSCAPPATGDVVTATPAVGGLADNGGPTPTEALSAGSPAINGGDPAGCTDLLGTAMATDQRGVARPQPAGGRCDIGAYERALPVVLTGGAAVTGTSVAFGATVSNPDAKGASASFDYGSSTAYGHTTATQSLPAGAAAQGLIASVSGLTPGVYHFRARATNSAGTALGSDGVFTVGRGPAVTTRPAIHVSAFAARLVGLVTPQGLATSAHFDYGTSTHYASHTRARSVGAGLRSVTFSTAVNGLLPGRTYHFRLVAKNASGTTNGSDLTFRTPRRPVPRGFTAYVKPGQDSNAPFVYTLSGRLSLPPGLSRTVGCHGAVTVAATVGRSSVGGSHTRIGSSCTYKVSLTLGGSHLGPSGRARLAVGFAGNGSLLPRSAAPLVVGFG